VQISIDKLYKQYKNANIDVYDRCSNNRLLHLIPHKFHATLIENELKELLQSDSFDPCLTLRNILESVCFIRILAFGNIELN